MIRTDPRTVNFATGLSAVLVETPARGDQVFATYGGARYGCPATSTGTLLGLVESSPSWPAAPEPQQYRLPVAARPQVWRKPASRLVEFVIARDEHGRQPVDRRSVTDLSPLVLAPAIRRIAAVRAHV